jgi:hypothetical protein
MDTRTPILILLGVLLAATALSVLGLGADNVAYHDKNQDGTVLVHYFRWNQTAAAQYSYWVELEAVPSRFTLGREYAEIVTGLLCALTGAAVAIGSWFARGQNKTSTNTGRKSIPFLPIALALATIAFILSIAITAWVWSPVMKFPIKFLNSIPLPPSVSNPSKKAPTTYESPFDYTPEVWNCLLAPYVVSPPQSRRMSGLCSEAKVARYMMIPVVLLSAVLMTALGWAWHQSKNAGSAEQEMETVKDIDQVSVETKDEA